MWAAHRAQGVRRMPGWHYCGVTTASATPFAWSRLLSPRQRAVWAVAGLVLLTHALLLGLVARAPGHGWRAQPPPAMQVRQIVSSAQTGPARAAPVAAPVTPEAAAPRRTAAAVPTGRPPADAPPEAPTLETQTSPAAAAQPATEPTPDPGGQTVPVYATRLPPPLTLQFDMRRGQAGGQAELDWRPLADHYRLTLRGQTVGAPLIGWASQGGFDSAGLAPQRYTESRRGRELRAANFQRDSGRITFSGPSTQHPLVAGAQDRLSWMVQLAAVLAANPALAVPEAQVSMWVVGTRGDAEVWTFTVQGSVGLDLPIGYIDGALHLKREPRRPYDTQVQVWLDPARHYLPAKTLLLVRASGEGTEFQLRQVVPQANLDLK